MSLLSVLVALSAACGLQHLAPGPVAGSGIFYSGQSEHALSSYMQSYIIEYIHLIFFLPSLFPVLSAAC